MPLSNRERYIVIAAVVVTLLLVADYVVLTPLTQARDRLEAKRLSATLKLQQANDTLAHYKRLTPLWAGMHSAMTTSPSGAESAISHIISKSASEAGMVQTLLKPDRLPDQATLPRISVQWAGSGGMSNITRFLHKLQTAELPLKVSDLHIVFRKETTDDLMLQLRVSTLYLPEATSDQLKPVIRADDAVVPSPKVQLDDYLMVSGKNMFLRDRRVAQAPRPPQTRPAQVETRSSDSQEDHLVLRGIVRHNKQWLIFLEDTQTGIPVRVAVGEMLANGIVAGADLDSIEYESNGASRTVSIGQTLAGSTSPAAGNSESSSNGAVSPADTNSILQRMLQRRREQELNR